jgi:hypothetical protein
MTAVNNDLKVQFRPGEEMEQHNFLGLRDGEVEVVSQEAVAKALAQKQAMGLPITVWNDGNPYRKYPDGRIEYIQL